MSKNEKTAPEAIKNSAPPAVTSIYEMVSGASPELQALFLVDKAKNRASGDNDAQRVEELEQAVHLIESLGDVTNIKDLRTLEELIDMMHDVETQKCAYQTLQGKAKQLEQQFLQQKDFVAKHLQEEGESVPSVTSTGVLNHRGAEDVEHMFPNVSAILPVVQEGEEPSSVRGFGRKSGG